MIMSAYLFQAGWEPFFSTFLPPFHVQPNFNKTLYIGFWQCQFVGFKVATKMTVSLPCIHMELFCFYASLCACVPPLLHSGSTSNVWLCPKHTTCNYLVNCFVIINIIPREPYLMYHNYLSLSVKWMRTRTYLSCSSGKKF